STFSTVSVGAVFDHSRFGFSPAPHAAIAKPTTIEPGSSQDRQGERRSSGITRALGSEASDDIARLSSKQTAAASVGHKPPPAHGPFSLSVNETAGQPFRDEQDRHRSPGRASCWAWVRRPGPAIAPDRVRYRRTSVE